jgi:acyl carrier protein
MPRDRVLALIARVIGQPAGDAPAAPEHWDSLAHIKVCLALEEEFGVHFTERQIGAMSTPDRILDVLHSLGVH